MDGYRTQPTADSIPLKPPIHESILPSDERISHETLENVNFLKDNNPVSLEGELGAENNRKASRPRSMFRWMGSMIDRLWTSYQKRAWSMYLFLLAGIAFAVGHHLFYWSLIGKEATHQSLMLRYGTILAFCAKACLGASVILARRQRVWMVVRHRVARLGTIDSIFTAAEDVTALFDWRAIKKAKVATCLAIYAWLTPLIVVLASETLSVVGGIKEATSFCPEARTLNFAIEETISWRDPKVIGNITLVSLSLYNLTSENHPSERNFDYYHSNSVQLQMSVDRTINLRAAAVRSNAGQQICPQGWNCSYVVEFVAPGYKCTELANGVNDEIAKLDGQLPPFDLSDIVPRGSYSYITNSMSGEYGIQQFPWVWPGGTPRGNFRRPWPKYVGAFRTEPLIWVGYAAVDNYDILQPENRTVEGWNTTYTPIIFGCQHYETRYKVEFKYTEGLQSYAIKDREYLRKIVNTTYIPEEDADDGTSDRTTATPKRNYILPTNVRRYRRAAAFHSVGLEFRKWMNGTMAMPFYIMNTDLFRMNIMSPPNYLPVRHLQQKMTEMYEQIIISFLAEPQLLVVAWAANPSQPSGIGLGGNATNYPCLLSKSVILFAYNKVQLCLVYAVSITLALIAVLLGTQAAHQEGGMRDVKPSSILRAARAESLTAVREDNDIESIRDVKVGFGTVQEYNGARARGFGLAGHVVQEDRRPTWPFWRPGPRTEVPPEN